MTSEGQKLDPVVGQTWVLLASSDPFSLPLSATWGDLDLESGEALSGWWPCTGLWEVLCTFASLVIALDAAHTTLCQCSTVASGHSVGGKTWTW